METRSLTLPPWADAGPISVQESLILELARALHRFGAPAHHLEDAVADLARTCDVRAQIYSTTTALIISFSGSPPRTHLLRVRPGEIDLGKQAMLDQLLVKLTKRSIAWDVALARVLEIEEGPQRYGARTTTMAYAGVSGASAIFFRGSAADFLVATCLGLLLGFLDFFAIRRPAAKRIMGATAALFATLISLAVARFATTTTPSIDLLSGLIVLLPGLTLTVAMTELSTGNLVSGTARLMAAVVVLLELGFGVALGQAIAQPLGLVDPGRSPVPLPELFTLAGVAVAGAGFTVLFRMRPKDMPSVIMAGIVAYYGARIGSRALGPELGTFAAAMLLGIVSNLQARLFDRPASLLLTPGIIFLVPGSMGFRSVSAFLARDVVGAMDIAFQMTMVAVSLAAGILAANVAVSPRRAL